MYRAMSTWWLLNPDYAYEFYDDERALAYVEEHGGTFVDLVKA